MKIVVLLAAGLALSGCAPQMASSRQVPPQATNKPIGLNSPVYQAFSDQVRANWRACITLYVRKFATGSDEDARTIAIAALSACKDFPAQWSRGTDLAAGRPPTLDYVFVKEVNEQMLPEVIEQVLEVRTEPRQPRGAQRPKLGT